jgi:polar amino acid transport system permease protein
MIIDIIISEAFQFLKGTAITIILLLSLISFGLIVGILMTIMEVYGNKAFAALSIAMNRFFRGVPAVVLLFLFYYGFSAFLDLSSFIAATLALGFLSAANQSQIFKSAIKAISEKQLIAARSMGMSQIKAIRYIVLPQALRLSIGPWSNEFSLEIKNTSLAYTIGLVELLRHGQYIISYTRGNTLVVYGVCAVIYLVLTRGGNTLLYYIENKLWVPGFERRKKEIDK